MNTELQEIHRKLDLLLAEMQKLGAAKRTESERFGIQEAARRLHLSVSRVYALIYERKLHPLQRQKYSRIQFTEELLNQYTHANDVEKPAQCRTEHAGLPSRTC